MVVERGCGGRVVVRRRRRRRGVGWGEGMLLFQSWWSEEEDEEVEEGASGEGEYQQRHMTDPMMHTIWHMSPYFSILYFKHKRARGPSV